MSEVIENFIRRNPGLSERDSFEGFLSEGRISAWVGNDETRKERLRQEFGRVWGSLHVEAHPSPTTTARSGPAGPQHASGSRAVRVEVTPAGEGPLLAPANTPGGGALASPRRGSASLGGGRRLQVLCASCKRIEVWMGEDSVIACRRCGKTYNDMLQLVRVTPVGPFEFIFGQGWKGVAAGVGIAAGFAGLYYLLRWA